MAEKQESKRKEVKTKAAGAGLYACPSIKKPTLRQVCDIAQDFGFHLEDDDLKAMHKLIEDGIDSINSLDYLVEPRLPVRYPRLPGYRPEQNDNPYNAWFWRCEIKGATDGKLAGKKVAIKDNVAVAGVPMMNGCPAMEGFTPDFDATVVTRILDAGATIVGKSQCENLCLSGGSSTSFRGQVKNPHNPERSAGGSSSGSAVLISVGEVDLAIGGDQGGSIRMPACWTGVVGIKPTHGLVPYTGAMGMNMAIDHLGPMAKTVQDCALFLEVIAGYDNGMDARQHPHITVPEYTKELKEGGVGGLKVGLLTEGFMADGADPDVTSLLKGVVHKLADQGASVKDVSIPLQAKSHHIWSVAAGFHENFVNNEGQGIGHTGYYSTSFAIATRTMLQSRPNDLSDPMKHHLLQGEYLSRQYGSQLYCRGRNLVIPLRRAYDEALKTVDVLALPTIPYTAMELIKENDSMEDFFSKCVKMTVNTMAFNLTGHPAISVNAGFLGGLPVGLQLVGRHFDEVTVFKVAQAIEKIRDSSK